MLMHRATDAEKDVMIASIGPFWDANETWLVLGVGILLIAFPKAHGLVLTALYLPVALMLVGLILRGVAFRLPRQGAGRTQAAVELRVVLRRLGLAPRPQGWMLGRYITGFRKAGPTMLFAAPSRCCCRRPMCCWAPAG
jgi:cytochrome d ubiquinol oxidase subunit II